jgi:hypothetical protein
MVAHQAPARSRSQTAVLRGKAVGDEKVGKEDGGELEPAPTGYGI